MGIIEINAYNLEEYMDILGVDLAENVGRKGYRALALDEKAGNLIMWKSAPLKGSEMVSDILFFEASERSLGKELLVELVRSSSEQGIKKYHFTLTGINDVELGLLKSFGFSVKRTESRDVFSSLADIQLTTLKAVPDTIKPVSLNMLTYPEFRQQLTASLLKAKRGANHDIADLPMRWYDQDLSCAMLRDGEGGGLFLIHVLPSGALHPVFLNSNGTEPIKDMLVMIRYSLGQALKKYPSDRLIRIGRRNSDIKALVDKLLGEKRISTVFEGEVDFNKMMK